MENKKNLSEDLKIEEFAKELGLQLRLIFLENKPKKQASFDEVIKPIARTKVSKSSEVKYERGL